ncbi:MAG: aminotransferase [Candidatus Wallbacteria bacterium HGW-Wallbacteria-1]|jgi:aspartate/methionine/tyrosine aminotransferase|uniref:Aminotransferase n=1 Tax=Candidatus Wallbacteria bacterium HGW-Wallbacteria-1 TaxID=2013854 RepID=A0A2N1PND6_9BACT|nr:MAG: aminotransferase [Candidatus Wallbacteria bacterium HGW-Wallbacteria-1]
MKIEPFKLERYFARHEFTAPWLLCSSDCESMSVRDLLEMEPGASDALASLWLGYTESLGSPELRQAISELHEIITADDVMVHSGAQEAIFNFMNAAVEPGDHVIVLSPCYQSLSEVAVAAGAEVSSWNLHPISAREDTRNSWHLDIDELKSLLKKNTRLVVVNFPHNPTGFLPSREFFAELSALSDLHGFTIFSDEVYRGLEYNSADRLPCMADINPRAISLGVMSKTYGLAGLRIGWIATKNSAVYQQMAAFKDYTTICNSALSEFLAALALRNAPAIAERNLGIINGNLQLLNRFFQEFRHLFTWYEPKAGPIAFPGLKMGDCRKFCSELIEKAGVLLLPGNLYNENLNCFRIGFGRANMPQALEKFREYLLSGTRS